MGISPTCQTALESNRADFAATNPDTRMDYDDNPSPFGILF
jgi:hypothetical protein